MKPVTPPRRIGFLLFDGLTALDLVGPMDAFATAGAVTGAYELVTIGLRPGPVAAESGLLLQPATTLADCPPLDTLLVPGGSGLREPACNAAVVAWIMQRAESIRRIASVCTGIYGLAPTGLLDGRKVTTHWAFAEDVARTWPALQLAADALHIKDGKIYTSAGVTAGIDLSLALIEEDLGRLAALGVARELVVYVKRPGGQQQYSEPLRSQIAVSGRLGEMAAYIDAHLADDLSSEALAQFAHLSVRQLSRRFQQTFQTSPATYVKTVRLNRAREILDSSTCRITPLAAMVGFASDDVFRRAFEQQFGLSPSAYRQRFAGPT